MAGNGPAPKPAEQKKLEGTYRADRDEQTGVNQAPPGRPNAPADLPPEALKIWKVLATRMVKLKTLAKVDGGVLEAFCRNLALARKLDKLGEDEPIIETAQGQKINPALAEARKRWELVKSLGADLGLSYAARCKAPIPTRKDEQDPDEAFLFGNQQKRPRARA